MKKIKSNNVVIVAHKFVTHPDDELVAYLNKNKISNLLHIGHSFYEAPDRRSYYVWYKNGLKYKEKRTLDYSFLPSPLLYAKEIFFTIWWVFSSRIRWDNFIGMDGLCVLAGNILKSLGSVRRTIYWAIDFVPTNRFTSNIVNILYHRVNIHGYKNSDEMWDLSPRMAEARDKFLGIKKSDYKSLRVVQYGMWVDRIKKYDYKDCDKNTLVFMGRLIESQGVQLILEAMPEVIKRNPKLRFKVIGTGPYRDELIKYAKKLKIYEWCDFKGKISDHREVESEIARSSIAVAPYIKSLDKWTYYADPGKVKTYLACGVPVLLTELPWNARDIVNYKCGVIINENPNIIAKYILNAMKPKFNNEFRKNAINYARKFNYTVIFENLEI